MCGIAGYVHVTGAALPDAVLERMLQRIKHRGPDATGAYRDRWAALGHQRLSIVDLATGQQPMANEDGRCWIIYNGEVFNHAALRPPLERRGHVYKSRSDTETILHAYEEHGDGCVDSLRGMFAFVIWDRESRRLFVARDRLGIKPFYYYWDGRAFVFASEIKAILEHPSVSPALETSVLPEYLAFGFVNDERTFFSGIRRLMPGHTLRLQLDGDAPRLEIRQYWDVPPPSPAEPRPDLAWILEFRRRLEESVQLRLMSDVPLGMFLSGGLDSGAIAGLMSRLVPERIKTFSVGYREEAASELAYARRVAAHLGTDHHEIVIGKDEFFQSLPKLVWHEDEPIFWPSSVPLYFVSQLAAKHVKVVLTGEGSDELFGGYGRYAYYLFNRKCMDRYRHTPEAARRWVRERLMTTALLGSSIRRKLQHTFLGRLDSFESLQLDNFYAAFSEDEQRQFMKASFTDGGAVYANYRRYFDGRADHPLLHRMLHADMKTYLVELLMKQDQMSMAASIESRVPFLDHPFVEFGMQVPDHLKIRGTTGKYILKEAVRDLLPREIIERKKLGFPTPFHQWMEGPRAGRIEGALLDPEGLLASYFDLQRVKDLLEQHGRGRIDGTDRLWRLLSLQIWGDVFLRRSKQESGIV